jgi:hypothetical protein
MELSRRKSLKLYKAAGVERGVGAALWLASKDAGAGKSAAGAVTGKHIFTPSHCWPHQQRPSALIRQWPVPQHLGSSCMGKVVKKLGMVRLAGIEPTTLGFGGQYSIH